MCRGVFYRDPIELAMQKNTVYFPFQTDLYAAVLDGLYRKINETEIWNSRGRLFHTSICVSLRSSMVPEGWVFTQEQEAGFQPPVPVG